MYVPTDNPCVSPRLQHHFLLKLYGVAADSMSKELTQDFPERNWNIPFNFDKQVEEPTNPQHVSFITMSDKELAAVHSTVDPVIDDHKVAVASNVIPEDVIMVAGDVNDRRARSGHLSKLEQDLIMEGRPAA